MLEEADKVPNHYVRPTHSYRGGREEGPASSQLLFFIVPPFPPSLSLSLSVREEAAFFFNDEERAMAGSLGLDEEGTIDRERERERERGYTPAAPAVEVVQALLVACSRTYTLDRTFDLGSRGIADDLGSYVTGYVERDGGRLVHETGNWIDREKESFGTSFSIYIYIFSKIYFTRVSINRMFRPRLVHETGNWIDQEREDFGTSLSIDIFLKIYFTFTHVRLVESFVQDWFIKFKKSTLLCTRIKFCPRLIYETRN